MDGLFHGKPYEQMDDLGMPLFLIIPFVHSVFSTIFAPSILGVKSPYFLVQHPNKDLHSHETNSLPFASSPLKIGLNAPKGKDHLPAIHFQVRTASFRVGNL